MIDVKRTNFRVVVTPEVWAVWGNKDPKAVCARIAAAIRRHVDEVADVAIESDVVCPFCGSLWETPPYCCDKGIEMFLASHPDWDWRGDELVKLSEAPNDRA
ncbi:MAG: hypothetical protein ABFE07_16970 [Armatimonadia bacterium]